MFNKTIRTALATVALMGAGAGVADAKIVIRWEKIVVPVMTQPADDGATTAKGSSAVVSLGKLGRVE